MRARQRAIKNGGDGTEMGLLAHGSRLQSPIIHVAWDALSPFLPVHDRIIGVAVHSTG
jgi:hypothetical protein